MFLCALLTILAAFSLLWAIEVFRRVRATHGASLAALFVGVNLMVIWLFPVLAMVAPR